jgi:hypothetical protein
MTGRDPLRGSFWRTRREVSWKKLTSTCQWHVIQVRAVDAEVGRWTKARKGPEIVDEMGLVVVPTICGNARPINLPLAVDLLHYLLEANDPAE